MTGREWQTARGVVSLARPVILGILNITPDSFSDGGQFLDPVAALRQAESLIADGADILDLGAESTRPGRPEPVSAEEEWQRLGPVLRDLASRFPQIPLSVDTVKSETAKRAVEHGAAIINDVSGLRLDPAIGDVAAKSGAGLILMHSRGSVSEMATYDHAKYEDVVGEVVSELQASVKAARQRGVKDEQIVLDPGLGFAKRPEQNFSVLSRIDTIRAAGYPVLVGPSRKRFLATGSNAPADRDVATAAACVAAYFLGAGLFRVHNVRMVREALTVAQAIRKG